MKFMIGMITNQTGTIETCELENVFAELCMDMGITIPIPMSCFDMTMEAKIIKDTLWESVNMFVIDNDISEVIDYKVKKLDNAIVVEGVFE